MYGMVKRHEIQVLLKAGLPQAEVAKIAGVSERTVREIQTEAAVTEVDDGAERRRRRIGRPSKAERFRKFVVELLGEDPELMSLEILRRARLSAPARGNPHPLGVPFRQAGHGCAPVPDAGSQLHARAS